VTTEGRDSQIVLVAIDLSPHADATLDFVLSMRWPADTSFILVCVINPPILAHIEAAAFAPDDLAGLYESISSAHLQAASRGVERLKGAGLHAQGRVVRGDPRVALIEEARREAADLIVLGSHGRTGLKKLVLGAVASHVVAHAPCSVLVVKLPGKHDAA
jgi:nucleotide-binding universal stress UspA family protein